MPIAFAFCTKRSTRSLAPRYGLSAAEKRQPQQWLEKSVSRLCPGGGRDRGGDSEGAARSSRPLAKSPPPGLGSRRSEFPLSRVASCPTTVEAARAFAVRPQQVRSKLACEPTAPGDEVVGEWPRDRLIRP